MKIDMSPKAVKMRLQMMDELWLLSAKLTARKHLEKRRWKVTDVNEFVGLSNDESQQVERRLER